MSAATWTATVIAIVAAGVAAGAVWLAVCADRARTTAVRAARADARAARADADAVRVDVAAARAVIEEQRRAIAASEEAWRGELLNVDREWQESATQWQLAIEDRDRRLDLYHRHRRREHATLDGHTVDPVDEPTQAWALHAGDRRSG